MRRFCDPTYFGFTTQVYYAARQMRKYGANPYDYMVQPGVPVAIPYAPGAGCEGPVVTVANLATSNLYNYTPYQPNEAALLGRAMLAQPGGNQNFYVLQRLVRNSGEGLGIGRRLAVATLVRLHVPLRLRPTSAQIVTNALIHGVNARRLRSYSAQGRLSHALKFATGRIILNTK